MKHTLILAIFLLQAVTMTAQSSPIEIEEKKMPGSIEFFASNSSDTDIEVTFALDKIKGVKGYSKPVTKVIASKERTFLLKIYTTGAYTYRQNLQMAMASNGTSSMASKVPNKGTEIKELTKGIVMFDKTGCGRCTMAGNYLFDHGVKFKVLNIGKEENQQLMNQMMREQGFKGGRFQTPVLVVDGVISHSHKNLNKFLRKLVD